MQKTPRKSLGIVFPSFGTPTMNKLELCWAFDVHNLKVRDFCFLNDFGKVFKTSFPIALVELETLQWKFDLERGIINKLKALMQKKEFEHDNFLTKCELVEKA